MEKKCKLLAYSLLHQSGQGHRQRGSLCSEGGNCLYAELLNLEESKVAELEEKTKDLEKKLARSVDELSKVKQAHMEFVSRVWKTVRSKMRCKEALQVFL